MTRSLHAPAVSVVVPLYNKRPYIAAAIESVLAQDTADYEVIVVDDGSTDGSADALTPYLDSLVCLRQENAGPGAARNRGLDASRGRYVAFLDADDAWRPSKLSTQLAYMEAHADTAWSAVNMIEVLPNGAPRGALVEAANEAADPGGWVLFEDWFEANAERQILRTSGVMIQREVVCEAGGFDPGIASGQDLDLWIRIARRYPRFALCLQPLVEYGYDVPGCITNSGGKRLRSKLQYMNQRFAEVDLQAMSPGERRFFEKEFQLLAKWALAAGDKQVVQAVLQSIPESWRSEWLSVRLLGRLPPTVLRTLFAMRKRLTGRG